MRIMFSKNIQRLRKERGMTQEALATELGISYQAVSKWETGQSYPDIELLPVLTDILETSIDALLGHVPGDEKKSIYQTAYADEDYYWGLQPNELCYEIIRLFPPSRFRKVLDVGCGEGKDALFFARNGYDVSAYDISQAGIDKVHRLAERFHVRINAFRADMMDYQLSHKYDIIYSSRALHHLKPSIRGEILRHFKEHTENGGVNAFNVYVKKPFIEPSPESDRFAFLWKSGEIFMHYHDWRFNRMDEIIYDCFSSGSPHQHAINIMIAQEPTDNKSEDALEPQV